MIRKAAERIEGPKSTWTFDGVWKQFRNKYHERLPLLRCRWCFGKLRLEFCLRAWLRANTNTPAMVPLLFWARISAFILWHRFPASQKIPNRYRTQTYDGNQPGYGGRLTDLRDAGCGLGGA